MPAISLPERAVMALASHLVGQDVSAMQAAERAAAMMCALRAANALYSGMFPGQEIVLRVVPDDTAAHA